MLFDTQTRYNTRCMYSRDPKVRKRKAQLRYLSYVLIAVIALVVGVVSLFYVRGFRLDSTKFEVRAGGLLKFGTVPQDATIYLDGKQIENTPYQSNVASGTHTIKYTKNQYKSWEKTIKVAPEQVLWANYAQLVPEKIETKSLRTFASLSLASASPTREWMLLQASPQAREFTLVNATDERNIRFSDIKIPAESLKLSPGENESFAVIDWIDNARLMLLQHTVGGQKEFILMPRDDPAKTINLNAFSNRAITSVQAAPTTNNYFFVHTNEGTLHRINSNDKNDVETIAERVRSFSALNENVVAYASDSEQTTPEEKINRSLLIWQRGQQMHIFMRYLPLDSPTYINFTRYASRDYLSVASRTGIDITENPLSATKKIVLNKLLPFSPQFMTVSPNNRFINLQSGAQMYTYDVELDTVSEFNLETVVPRPAQWIDDFRLADYEAGNVRMIEFDGHNAQQITQSTTGFDVLHGGDSESLITIKKNETDGRFELQQSSLRLPGDLPFLRV